jgi:tRNA dimethylallyltransferase
MPNKLLPKLIVVLGPTASGKSDFTVELAKKFNGEIISADSRQVYRGMDIGTGKITKKEMHGVPHHLLSVASPKRRFTVAQYKKLGQAAINKILANNKIPIICGGTGFYIDVLLENISIPEVKPDLKLRTKIEKLATKNLYEKLKKLDPTRAKSIDQFNRRRLIRALEIVIKTGKPVHRCVIPAKAGIQDNIAEFRAKPGMTNNEFCVLYIGIKKSPQELRGLISKRLQKRLKLGMLEEVKKLRRDGVSWKRLDDFGLEYRWIARYLQNKPLRTVRGKLTWEQMLSRLQKDIEHYAKRQMAWFKRNEKIHWTTNKREAETIINTFIENWKDFQ